MILFLYGQDTYRSRRKLQEIVEHYKKIHKSGLNLRFLEGEALVFQNFYKEFQTVSMFREKKLVVVENVFSKAPTLKFSGGGKASNLEFKERFSKEIKKFKDSKNVVLFYEEREVPGGDTFLNLLKKEAKFQEFRLLEGAKLKYWVKKEIENYGVKIEAAALNNLIQYIGNDLWRFSNEIKKLASYKLKCRDIGISSKEVEILVKPNIEADIFKTIDALALQNKKRALYLIHKHLKKGDYPLYLLTMINFQFRNLLIIKSEFTNDIRTPRINNLNKKLRMHPYVAKKALGQAQKFTVNELKKIYRKIFQADLDIKTGKLDAGTALDLLIAEI